MRRLAELAPGIGLDVVFPAPRVDGMLGRGEADLAVLPEGHAIEGHPRRVLFRDTFCAVVWSGHPRVGETLARPLFLELRHVMPGFGEHSSSSLMQRFLEAEGLVHEPAAVMPSFALVLETLVGTEYVATVPRRLAELYARRLPLRVLPAPVEFPPLVSVLQWHKHRDRDPFNAWLREQLVASAADGAS